MLVEFLTDHRADLIQRTRARVAERLAPRPTKEELQSGVPVFLDQLIDTLKRSSKSTCDEIERSAREHGAVLMDLGYTVAQVVHDYGDICQAVTELAGETDVAITADEFHTFNKCLDNAMAESVTEYSRLHERVANNGETERTGVFAHELRNRIAAAQFAFMSIQNGSAPVSGSVAAVVTRNLEGMTALVNRALVEVRLDTGSLRRERVHLHQLVADAEVEGTLGARVRGVALSVGPVDHGIDVEADPQILAGAIANLLQNAFKFTPAGGHVTLGTSAVDGRVHITIEDECGGLPPGKSGELFSAFKQHGADRSGLGLGLFISRKAVEASSGRLQVRDLPGKGCIFTIDLPRMRTVG